MPITEPIAALAVFLALSLLAFKRSYQMTSMSLLVLGGSLALWLAWLYWKFG
jgi:hypothetical protein